MYGVVRSVTQIHSQRKTKWKKISYTRKLCLRRRRLTPIFHQNHRKLEKKAYKRKLTEENAGSKQSHILYEIMFCRYIHICLNIIYTFNGTYYINNLIWFHVVYGSATGNGCLYTLYCMYKQIHDIIWLYMLCTSYAVHIYYYIGKSCIEEREFSTDSRYSRGEFFFRKIAQSLMGHVWGKLCLQHV